MIKAQIPFLGICVGMQVLADVGYENDAIVGLGWIPGEVRHIPQSNLVIPHMGWNNIQVENHKAEINKDFSCFDNKDFYFVHSYYFDCAMAGHRIANVEYGISFPAIIARDNIIATQFHPEKSGENGLDFLKCFLE